MSDFTLRKIVTQMEEIHHEGGPPVALVKAPESDLGACHWHPSLADHAAMTAALQQALAGLPDPWGTAAP